MCDAVRLAAFSLALQRPRFPAAAPSRVSPAPPPAAEPDAGGGIPPSGRLPTLPVVSAGCGLRLAPSAYSLQCHTGGVPFA